MASSPVISASEDADDVFEVDESCVSDELEVDVVSVEVVSDAEVDDEEYDCFEEGARMLCCSGVTTASFASGSFVNTCAISATATSSCGSGVAIEVNSPVVRTTS
jgi:hypothetical protein